VLAPYFALAPTLAANAFINWDLFVTLLAVGGLAAFLWRRDGWAGVLLGLGTAAKVYPFLFVLPLAVDRIRSREHRRAAVLVGASAGTWAAVNLPFAIVAHTSWLHFFWFTRTWPAGNLSPWGIFCHYFPARCPSVETVDALSVVFITLIAGAAWWRRARPVRPSNRTASTGPMPSTFSNPELRSSSAAPIRRS
jgi:hypothetical protein